MKKILLSALVLSFLGASLVQADDGEALCRGYKAQEISLNTVLKNMEELRRLKTVAKELEEKITDDENAREIQNLAEELEAQGRVAANGEVKGFTRGTASLGALVVASLIIKKTYNSDLRNANFLKVLKNLQGWEKFKAMHVPLKRKVLFTVAALALAGTIFEFNEGFKHASENNRLELLLEKANKLLKLANDLTPLKERAEAESTKLQIIHEILVDMDYTCP